MRDSPRPRREIAIEVTPAIIRTAFGMSTFLQLDQELDRKTISKSARGGEVDDSLLAERLRDLAPSMEYESESDSSEDESVIMEFTAGEKRKLFVISVHCPS
jgi:hypothetical protein